MLSMKQLVKAAVRVILSQSLLSSADIAIVAAVESYINVSMCHLGHLQNQYIHLF